MCTFFRQKLKSAPLQLAKGREWPLKIFYDQSTRKNVVGPGGDRTRDLPITSRTRIRLNHWGQFWCVYGLKYCVCFVFCCCFFPHLFFFWCIALRKHAYSNILKISPPKTESFQIKILIFFIFLLKTEQGRSSEYPQSMFSSRNKKNNVYPCKHQFYYIKAGFKGIKIIYM